MLPKARRSFDVPYLVEQKVQDTIATRIVINYSAKVKIDKDQRLMRLESFVFQLVMDLLPEPFILRSAEDKVSEFTFVDCYKPVLSRRMELFRTSSPSTRSPHPTSLSFQIMNAARHRIDGVTQGEQPEIRFEFERPSIPQRTAQPRWRF